MAEKRVSNSGTMYYVFWRCFCTYQSSEAISDSRFCIWSIEGGVVVGTLKCSSRGEVLVVETKGRLPVLIGVWYALVCANSSCSWGVSLFLRWVVGALKIVLRRTGGGRLNQREALQAARMTRAAITATKSNPYHIFRVWKPSGRFGGAKGTEKREVLDECQQLSPDGAFYQS